VREQDECHLKTMRSYVHVLWRGREGSAYINKHMSSNLWVHGLWLTVQYSYMVTHGTGGKWKEGGSRGRHNSRRSWSFCSPSGRNEPVEVRMLLKELPPLSAFTTPDLYIFGLACAVE
jgi:hypothetical protein